MNQESMTRGGGLKPKKLKEKNKTKTGLKVFTILCVLLIAFVFFYNSYAYYEEQKSLEIINGTVEDPGDLYFTIYVDGEVTYNMPSSTDGYVFSSGTCTNDVTVTWDSDTWSANVDFSAYSNTNSNSSTKCILNFKTTTFCDLNIDSSACQILALYTEDSTELVYDGTTDNNLRYIGASPNNYIDIGDNVLWRIIGVFEADDGGGNTETRLKIIRSSSIGTYSWDNKSSGLGTNTSGYTYGSNDWTDARLMMLLNDGYEDGAVDDNGNTIYAYEGSLYWNSKSGTCYSGNSDGTKTCNFTYTGLTTTAQAYFDDALWTLGGASTSYTSSSNGLVNHWYTYERGTTVSSGHATTWTGKIGLMYVSDYGYATSGGETYDRDTCLSYSLGNWNSYTDCYSNDWLYTGSTWTLNPSSSTLYPYHIFTINSTGYLYFSTTSGSYAVLPTGYLSSSVTITSGDGSEDNPFTAEIGS